MTALPSDWSRPSWTVPEDAPCIVPYLCTGSTITEVKYIKEYKLKKSIDNLFNNGLLVGKEDDYNYVFDPAVFDRNFKNITSTYETEFLKKGHFDDRIFLGKSKSCVLRQV